MAAGALTAPDRLLSRSCLRGDYAISDNDAGARHDASTGQADICLDEDVGC
jgi:hypothetical protein